MSTNPVVTVTDELIEELEKAAGMACQYSPEDWFSKDSFFSVADEDAAYIEKAKPWTILALLHHIRIMQQELKAAHISVDNCELFRRDAERYQFLKDQGHFRAMSIDMGGNHSWTGMGRHVGKGETVDAAIDAAMTASHSS